MTLNPHRRLRLNVSALALSGALCLALTLSLFFAIAGRSIHGPSRHSLGSDSVQFSVTTEAELEDIYHRAWLLTKESSLPSRAPFDWDSWEYRYKGQLRTHKALSQALAEMLDSLNDPQCHYFSAAAWRAHQLETNGKPGIGVSLSGADPQGAKINSCWRGSPAQRAGLRWGDVFLSVNGLDVSQMEPDKVTAILNEGDEGSIVELTVRRQGVPLKVTLKRAGEKTYEAEPQFNEFHARRYDLSELTIPGLRDESAAAVLDGKIEEMSKTFPGLRGLALDLRGKKGGSARNLATTAALFLEKGVICRSTRTENGQQVVVTYKIESGKLIESVSGGGNTPVDTVIETPVGKYKGLLAVIVDSETAGAAELLAAALQENGRATVYGVSTAGKGLGQSLFILPGGHVLQLSTTTYATPAGRHLDGQGVKPDVIAPVGQPVTPEGAIEWFKSMYPRKEDSQGPGNKADKSPPGNAGSDPATAPDSGDD